MTKDEMIDWFKSAPKGSRHQRLLWAAHKIARLTGVTDGGAYKMLLSALIEAERLPRRPIPGLPRMNNLDVPGNDMARRFPLIAEALTGLRAWPAWCSTL